MWYFMKNETRMIMITLNPLQQKTMVSIMIPPDK